MMSRVARMGAALAAAAAFALVSWEPARGQIELEPQPLSGADLYISNCQSCHGPEGRGTPFGPTLESVGAAAADFQLRTGRMPLADPNAPTIRKPPAFDKDEIAALVEYVATFGAGPDVPDLALERADLSSGNELFLNNCAPCHGSTANGGAVGGSAFAPSLFASEPLDVAEAMITGPGEMPVFGFSEDEVNDIVAYIVHLQEADPPGGLDVGGVGPVPEGYVAWAMAMVVLVFVVLFIGRSGPKRTGE